MCLIAKGVENEHVYTKQADVFYRDEYVTAFIASHWWPNNPGHVIIIPNKHIENIYDLPTNLSDRIHQLEQTVAVALKKTYECDGVSSRQHNEPAGDQDVWHYHLHIFPRYLNDDLYLHYRERKLSAPPDRQAFVKKILQYFNKTT